MEPHRAERVAEALRSELEEILNYEMDDPRLAPATVTEVVLSPDGRKVLVRLHFDGSGAEADESLKVIEKAKGYIRRLVAERVDVFRAPDLRFEADLSPHLSEKAQFVLRRLRKGRPRDASPGEKNPAS